MSQSCYVLLYPDKSKFRYLNGWVGERMGVEGEHNTYGDVPKPVFVGKGIKQRIGIDFFRGWIYPSPERCPIYRVNFALRKFDGYDPEIREDHSGGRVGRNSGS